MRIPTLRLGEAYRNLWTLNDPWILLESPRGCGKSVAVLARLVQLALEYPGSRIALIRRYRSDLTKSVLPTLEEEVFPMFGLTTPPGGWLDRKSRTEYLLATSDDRSKASRMVPIGLDSDGAGSLLSTAWTFAYANEGQEIPFNLLVRLDGAMRWVKSPTMPGLPTRSQVFVDANPVDPGHPLNKQAEDCPDSLRMVRTREDYARTQEYNRRPAAKPQERWKRLICRVQDNPGYWNSKDWDYTPAGKTYVTERLGGLKGYLRSRWLDGLWKAPSGIVFPEWDESIHLIDDFYPPPDWPQATFYDPGWGTTAVEFITISDDGGIYVFDEIYEGEKRMELHCEELKRRKVANGLNILRDFADPNEAFSNRAQEISCARQAIKYGVRFVPWPADKGKAFDAGVEMIRQLLAATEKMERGEPVKHYLKVCRRCTGLRSNFSSWSFKKNRSGEVVEGAENYEKGNDHGMDCLRGGVSSNFLQAKLAQAQSVGADESDIR